MFIQTGTKGGIIQQPLQQSINSNSSSEGGAIAPKFPYMGHSRTPSACSAISFCSSILSEPISENYPHSEPETDSRGYEIVRDKNGGGGGGDDKGECLLYNI